MTIAGSAPGSYPLRHACLLYARAYLPPIAPSQSQFLVARDPPHPIGQRKLLHNAEPEGI